MRASAKLIAAAAFAFTGLAGASVTSANAAPMPVLGAGLITPDAGLTDRKSTRLNSSH